MRHILAVLNLCLVVLIVEMLLGAMPAAARPHDDRGVVFTNI